MKKISFKLTREVITALAALCKNNMNTKLGDTLFDAWIKDFCEAMMLRLARYRNKSAKVFALSFSLSELLFIRELTDLQRIATPTAPEVLFMDVYILTPALSVTV